jgi:phosphatidylserine decarboxylase
MTPASALACFVALCAAFASWRFYFFHRNPARRVPPGATLLSPADGRILYAERVSLAEPADPYHLRVHDVLGLRGRYDVTAIYLSIFDVHFVRAPAAGCVHLRPVPPLGLANSSMGLSLFFAALRRPLPIGRRGFAGKNELLGITFGNDEPPAMALVLMADWWMDQIAVYVREGQHVERGQILAKIHMGSQVDVWTRADRYYPCRAVGDRVLAGLDSLTRGAGS